MAKKCEYNLNSKDPILLYSFHTNLYMMDINFYYVKLICVWFLIPSIYILQKNINILFLRRRRSTIVGEYDVCWLTDKHKKTNIFETRWILLTEHITFWVWFIFILVMYYDIWWNKKRMFRVWSVEEFDRDYEDIVYVVMIMIIMMFAFSLLWIPIRQRFVNLWYEWWSW